jgi:ADP-heptose:LPS heptosyltransferase
VSADENPPRRSDPGLAATREEPVPGPARPSTPARRLERGAKRWLSRLLAGVVRPRSVPGATIAELDVRRLLVVRQHNQMGDTVCALPALRALRRAWPDARLTFVAAPLCENLLREHPDIDELLVFKKQEMWRPWKLVAFVRRLRQPRPDLAVVMNTVSFSTTSALLAWASGARVRAGGSSLQSGSHLSRAVYHLELPAGPPGVPEVEHNLAPVRALGIAAPFERPSLAPAPASIARARDFLSRTLPGNGPVVVAHVGAGKLPNVWPAEHFAAVLQTLRVEHGARVVLTEGPSDAAAVGAVAARLENVARWRHPLGETMGLLACAQLVLSNDTGLAHVAAAVGVPTVVIYGPTDPQRWQPPGEHVRAIRAATGRVADVEPTTVTDAARTFLARDRARAGIVGFERPLP